MSGFLWIIDNGHGSDTSGKRSPKFEDGKQLFEYEFNRAITHLLFEKLDAAGISYYEVCPETTDISLKERVKRANTYTSDLPKLFISIHGNAFGKLSEWTTPSGIETYYYPSSKKGSKMAAVFQEQLIDETGWKNRKTKTAKFYVLKYTSMPAVLTENGFFTNKDECKMMLDIIWRKKIAEAHFTAIKEINDKSDLFFN